jgi:tetratricopeptide (TPR) repeat protein
LNHPAYATSLHNLAGLYYDQGRYELAEPLYKQSLAIRKSVLGIQHPDYREGLKALAQLYRQQGRQTEAGALENSR